MDRKNGVSTVIREKKISWLEAAQKKKFALNVLLELMEENLNLLCIINQTSEVTPADYKYYSRKLQKGFKIEI